MTVRLIDAGTVSAIRSQTIYHAIGYALDESTPDTILLVSPAQPYVSIGYHQDVEREVDVAYCQAKGLPIIRREVGGGAVYLDEGQVFCQWIFPRSRLPRSIEARFKLYATPLIETYRALGVAAYYRPINDIHVAGKKIGGIGAATIGEAEIVVGSLMLDFNFELMARVLKVSSEKMRDKVYQSLQEYMTTLTRQLGHTPDRQMVKDLYVAKCAEALKTSIIPGSLTEREYARAEELDTTFASAEWLYQKGGLRQTGVKIHADVQVVEKAYKAPGGLIRVLARVHEDRLEDVSLSGDFTLQPALAVAALEQALRGQHLTADGLRGQITELYQRLAVQSPGITVEDWVQAVMLVQEE
ncbi:MAG: hypothetical protein A2Z04_09585 [Chloroflexi bacterium RBG_16_57_9]|nr:MAG: hypothetical protein A2Z04_09585 [Chloroflexi bacterium RBG_16_57_9]